MQVVYAIRRTYIVISFLYKGRFTGLSRQWRTRDTNKQREGNMNTIQINTVDGIINYTESEVTRYIEKAGQVDKLYDTIKDLRYKVRDFFSEGEWSNGEQTVSKSDLNELLESIGCDRLTSKYAGTFTITGTFSVEAENEEEVDGIVQEGISVDFYSGEIDVDQIETFDVQEDE